MLLSIAAARRCWRYRQRRIWSAAAGVPAAVDSKGAAAAAQPRALKPSAAPHELPDFQLLKARMKFFAAEPHSSNAVKGYWVRLAGAMERKELLPAFSSAAQNGHVDFGGPEARLPGSLEWNAIEKGMGCSAACCRRRWRSAARWRQHLPALRERQHVGRTEGAARRPPGGLPGLAQRQPTATRRTVACARARHRVRSTARNPSG